MDSLREEAGGEVFTWGSAEMGQLGYSHEQIAKLPKDSEGFPFQPTPQPIKSLASIRITQIAGGEGHTLAVTSTGKVYTWGASACGQLGLSKIDSMPRDSEGYPYHPEPSIVEGLLGYKVAMVACGDAHTAALTAEGVILTWGGGGCGQLGHPDTKEMPKDEDGCPFQPEPRVVLSLNVAVKFISCGKAHSLAITEEGSVFTWGAGACGQLGHADMSSFHIDEDGYPFHPTPKLVSSLKKTPMRMAACGDVHTLVLAKDGAVYSFGGGSFGQLGLGNIASLPIDVDNCPYMPVPKLIDSLKGVTQVACGDSHSVALTCAGEVFAWGEAMCGKLGIAHLSHLPRDSDDKPYVPEPTLVSELKEKEVISLACGESHTLVLTKRGILYSFGGNNFGQLGVERSSEEYKAVHVEYTPAVVTGLLGKNIVEISCGGVHNAVVAEVGSPSLAATLYACYKQELFTDISFKIETDQRSYTIKCHKVVLAARSSYFRELIKSKDSLTLEYSYSTFARLIDFLYRDDIEILKETLSVCSSVSQIVELLNLAHAFQLGELKSACESHLMRQISPHLPSSLFSVFSSETRNLVLLPDGRAAIVPSALYAQILSQSILIQDALAGSLTSEGTCPLGKSLLKELNNSESSDVTLLVQGKPIYAHKVILASRSEYFSALYSHNFREAQEGVVDISDVNYHTMIVLLTHMYCDEAEIDIEKVLELLELCERFSVNSVKHKCEAAIAPTLTVKNAAALYKHAKAFHCESLQANCLAYIGSFYSEVIVTPAFEDLDKESIIEIMRYNR